MSVWVWAEVAVSLAVLFAGSVWLSRRSATAQVVMVLIGAAIVLCAAIALGVVWELRPDG